MKQLEGIPLVWLSVVRRMQSACSRSSGAAIVTIKVMVDKNGVPCYWTEPTLCRLEPSSRSDEIIDSLSD